MKTAVFFLRPDVPGFWSVNGFVDKVLIDKSILDMI